MPRYWGRTQRTQLIASHRVVTNWASAVQVAHTACSHCELPKQFPPMLHTSTSPFDWTIEFPASDRSTILAMSILQLLYHLYVSFGPHVCTSTHPLTHSPTHAHPHSPTHPPFHSDPSYEDIGLDPSKPLEELTQEIEDVLAPVPWDQREEQPPEDWEPEVRQGL